ncbi:MAG TPA: hypothetical protein VNG12_11210 [Acidimicrobiales bacterium]|nr:hypothetical protein [Acidimicrobiales bacterium]
MSDLDSRLIPMEYDDDEPVHVYIPDGAERWIPERLWFRLFNLGRAYETHLLPLLPGTTEPQTLNGQQVATLIDEVEFLMSIVDDTALSGVTEDLLPLLAEARNAGTLVVEGP